ncbi:MAG: hypothetical protein LUC98_01375 [Lachnospiraceae bacterium]|nr:hypothetical protein [Lachnospiraceae bacterium]
MLKVNSNLMQEGVSELEEIASQLESLSQAVVQVNTRLTWKVSGSATVSKKLTSYSENLNSMSLIASSLGVALSDSVSLYAKTENELSNGSNLEEQFQNPAVSNNNTEEITYSSLAWLFGAICGLYADVGSAAGKLKTVTEYLGYVFDNEFLGTVSMMSKEMGDFAIFKVAGWMDDGKDLIEAIEKGDADSVEDLIEKYVKKGIKTLTSGTTLPKGVVGATYINIAWNAGENLIDSATEFGEDPSLATAASAVWAVTGEALFDTGTDLAETGLELVYSVVGKEFDGDDFEEAMECLGSLVNPISWITGENSVVVNAVGDVINNTLDDLQDSVNCIASTVAEGAVNAGKTVAAWISSW